MPTKTKTNRAKQSLQFTKILAGIVQHVTAAIILGGKSVTPQALSAVFQAVFQAESDLDAARTVVAAKVQAKKAAQAAAVALVSVLHHWAVATFGAESTVLADFGFPQAKPAARTAEVKAAAAAKARATRAAHKAAKQPHPAPVPPPVTTGTK
ncbi:MAG TPA: hypothetical protein VIF15_12320 [Polyangiaceae bacterium]|jgi:hypothetical protein